ncbi:hypothetical protein H4R18_000251 [Coemansia javaensis]|uniref:F-box domain-containing protein n=1 Tax=Coemansia javaensis TaxID=2761396 RepID=A0A9W8HP49_9FUNG|nr:hypothetical protein H4R18_000251 [Coemansia javaensis]
MALHINSLPDDILAMVIGYAQRLEQETRGLWSKRQPVLSVCRRWRCVAMPIVYREIFVWCEEGTASTNAGLAAELGAAHMARSVCMTVLYDGDPVRSMRSALSALQGDDKPGRRWDRVKRLDLYVHPVADEALAKSQGAADVVRAVANLLPGVEALRLDDHASDSFTLSVYRGLASAYAGQLRRLNSSYIWGASTSPLARLTHLEVRFDALRCLSMPRVCTDTLVSLSLVGATTQQAWLQLMEGGTDGPAALGSLEHLYVSYHSGPWPLARRAPQGPWG